MNLSPMAMQGRKVNFNKVMSMIENMITLLSKEQQNDENKKTYCNAELEKADDEEKTLEGLISDSAKTMANSKELVRTLSEDIVKVASEIRAMDKSVGEATKQRKEENAAFVEELQSNNAAVEILDIAKNRLNKFYSPKLYRAPPSRELSEADSITLNMGGTLAPTQAPGGIAGTGIVALQDAFSFVQVSRQDSSGVTAMLDTLVKNIKKQLVEMQAEEKDAQAEYEQFVASSAEKHAASAKAVSVKESAKADAEASLMKHGHEHKTASNEAMANGEYLQGLHKECDWMLKNYGVRQEARSSEVASLRQAKAVLAGADYSFLQLEQAPKHNLRRVRVH